MQHSNTDSCILLKFYIKPQRFAERSVSSRRCILLKFYIKPQRSARWSFGCSCCILLKFYIKPQLVLAHARLDIVVSY